MLWLRLRFNHSPERVLFAVGEKSIFTSPKYSLDEGIATMRPGVGVAWEGVGAGKALPARARPGGGRSSK